MSAGLSADVLLENYLQGFLWADEDWLEVEGSSATYWQARLPQTTTVAVLPDGRTKWRIRTRIVEQVPAEANPHQLCVALNRYAAGWSFAYDSSERTIDAIAAISALPQWDTFFLRLSEKAKLSAWMSDVIAERLAAAVGGVPAFSHPGSQSGLRQRYDGTYHYLESLRGRPEWVLDLTRYLFPPIEDIAPFIAKMVGTDPGAVWSDTNTLRILIGSRMGLTAGFDTHPIFGDGWQSALKMPGRPITETVAGHLSAITWALFDSPDTNLLGGWTNTEDGLTFQQWNTMSEVRNQEQLGSYTDHSEADLWGFTSTLSDAMGAYSQSELPDDDEVAGTPDAADRAKEVVAAIAAQALPAVTERPAAGEGNADRRLLWLEHRETLALAAWFNPMGPTVTSTEVCASPDGTEYLVHFRRHPFAPYYRVLGPITSSDAAAQIHREATDLLLGESLPNVLALWDKSGSAAADVPDAVREAVLDAAEKSGADLSAAAAWIEQTMGNPWEFAAADQGEADRVKAAAAEAAAARPASDRGFAAWWDQASNMGNLLANFRCLPDAWDGALNTQSAFGNLGQFDAGPLVVTFSKIGMPGT